MCVLLHKSLITQEGHSALMRAAMKGKTEIVVELVKAGANVDMQNKVCQYHIFCKCTCMCTIVHIRVYTTLSVHVQRGLLYLICVSVCLSVCMSVLNISLLE